MSFDHLGETSKQRAGKPTPAGKSTQAGKPTPAGKPTQIGNTNSKLEHPARNHAG